MSVLMPVHNAEKFLGMAIESILNQTLRDFEFVIINDGSTDSSADIIRSYQDQRIHLFENPVNVGIVASLNRGLSMAKGDFIARMDADDISMPTRLEKQLDFLIHNESIGVVGSKVRFIDHMGKLYHVGFFPKNDSLIRWTMCFSNPMAHGSIMMRREVVMKAGGYPDSPAEDYNLWEQLSWVTAFSNLPDVLFHLRRHEESLVSTRRNQSAILSDSALISQRRISKVLGEEVPISLVENLRGSAFRKSEGALQTAELIRRLVTVYTADKHLILMHEKQHIYNDAARRLLKIMLRPNINPNHRWQIFQMAYRLDSIVLARVFMRRIGRAIRNLYLSAP